MGAGARAHIQSCSDGNLRGVIEFIKGLPKDPKDSHTSGFVGARNGTRTSARAGRILPRRAHIQLVVSWIRPSACGGGVSAGVGGATNTGQRHFYGAGSVNTTMLDAYLASTAASLGQDGTPLEKEVYGLTTVDGMRTFFGLWRRFVLEGVPVSQRPVRSPCAPPTDRAAFAHLGLDGNVLEPPIPNAHSHSISLKRGGGSWTRPRSSPRAICVSWLHLPAFPPAHSRACKGCTSDAVVRPLCRGPEHL